MNDESLESIMEMKEDIMVSPAGDSEPTLRPAHFLKPIASSSSLSETVTASSSVPPVFDPQEWPLVTHFNGWRSPRVKWFQWLDTLQPRYEKVWHKAGIFEAIMSTKCSIAKNQNLVYGVAEKWRSTTNTFLFPWGEATITLEDVMVLGGYPVVGDPVFFTPLQDQEMRHVEEKLIHARREPWRIKKGKANIASWMELFANSGSDVEHEAFLAAWLSMFLFSHNGLIRKFVFPIAIHLARGNTIALAPAVLASIYKDLSLLKKTIVRLKERSPLSDNLQLEVALHSPFYLVQIWLWERFKNLQPKPNLIDNQDPVLFRWHKVKALKIDNVRLELNSALEDFIWRPYVKFAGKSRAFYPDNETWLPFEKDLDNKLVSFVTCLRVSELVGIESNIQQYLPHRVAMQFGMDQDVPGCVPRFNSTKAVAWENYCRPISDKDLYLPSRLFEADVTTRYVRWWKESVLCGLDFAKKVVRGRRRGRSFNSRPCVLKARKSGNDADVPPGFPPKFISTVNLEKSCYDGLKTKGDDAGGDVLFGFLPTKLKSVLSGNSVQDGGKAGENIDADFATSFPSKHDTLTCNFEEDCKPILEENKRGGMNMSNQSSAASTTDYGDDGKRILPLTKPVANDIMEPSIGGLKEEFEDGNRSKNLRLSSNKRVGLSGIQGERYGCASGTKLVNLEQRISSLETKFVNLEQRISSLETVTTKLKRAKFGNS
ncbi:hypothetical protein RJT34_00430 [Clitoria ternatea]|uniref:Aminotransferase-like plant mobile domain-containing protein n=1 Tax=Clitoria ternatea TaxID=43366 RepID=A0AAN9PZA0_CLITE